MSVSIVLLIGGVALFGAWVRGLATGRMFRAFRMRASSGVFVSRRFRPRQFWAYSVIYGLVPLLTIALSLHLLVR